MEPKVKIDYTHMLKNTNRSVERVKWAKREAFRMAGGHFRKELRKDIEAGNIGGPQALTAMQGKLRKSRKDRGPLAWLGRLVRFKVGRAQGKLKVEVGFLPIKRIRFQFGNRSLTVPAFAKIHEYGKRVRVTEAVRRRFAAMGFPIKKATKYFNIPARPMIGPFFARTRKQAPNYIERRFWEKFLGSGRPDLKI